MIIQGFRLIASIKIARRIAALFVGVAYIFSSTYVYAQSPSVQAARDEVKDKLEQSVSIEDASTRKISLMSIVNLTRVEAEEAAERIKVLRTDDDIFISHAAETLAARVNGIRVYSLLLSYQFTSGSMSDEQVAIAAGSLKEWRQEIFDPTIRQVLDLALIKQGGEAFRAATRRLDNAATDIALLQRSVGGRVAPLLSRIDLATKLIARAGSSYQKARALFSKGQDDLFAAAITQDFFRNMTLERSERGDFVSCLPQELLRKDSPLTSSCQAAFRTSSDGYYMLFNATGETVAPSLTQAYRVSGPAVILKPLLGVQDKILGAVFVTEINRSVGSALPSYPVIVEASASVVETVRGVMEPTVQSLIKSSVGDIKAMYTELVAVINLAKQLAAKK